MLFILLLCVVVVVVVVFVSAFNEMSMATTFPGRTRSAVPAGSGRRALRAAKRAHVSAPLACIDAVKGPDKFEQCCTPHRRVISSDFDLLALNVSISSACRVCSSSVSGRACVSVSGGACCGSSRCSRCGRAFVCESGTLCRVCHINQLLVLATIRGNTVMKVLEEQRR